MMIQFFKYHGAGNDFILIDARIKEPDLNQAQIKALCDRNFGIGADGLMYLLQAKDFDFEMKYFNSDGHEGSMCGNGGRCIVSFAYDCGIKKSHYHFLAIDGTHSADILELGEIEKQIRLQMQDVLAVEKIDKHFVLNTGSPHHLSFCKSLDKKNVFAAGKSIRYSEKFKADGINVNFIEQNKNQLFVRTYERGVENETLACGTGVTAAAIGAYIKGRKKFTSYQIKTLGGNLRVSFKAVNSSFTEVYLEGPAKFVFQGTIQI
jgi:diaminopimelate epimerase